MNPETHTHSFLSLPQSESFIPTDDFELPYPGLLAWQVVALCQCGAWLVAPILDENPEDPALTYSLINHWRPGDGNHSLATILRLAQQQSLPIEPGKGVIYSTNSTN